MKNLFRIILVVLTVIPAFSSDGHTGSDNSSNSDALTISLYSGVGYENLGASMGIGTEWMYRNVSVNLGFGKDNSGRGYSVGAKIYNPDPDSKNRIF